MKAESPVERWYEAWNTKDWTVAGETVGPDVVVHFENAPDVVGIDAYKQMVMAFWDAFDQLTLTVEQVVADQDRILMRSLFEATFVGEFMGLPPTGKQVAWHLHNLYCVERGLWVEA